MFTKTSVVGSVCAVLATLGGAEAKVVPFQKHYPDEVGGRRLNPESASADSTFKVFDPRMVRSAAVSDADNTTMTSIQAVYYVGPIEINSQTFQVIYDTGSNLLWVPSSSCSDCVGHPRYTGPSTSANEPFTVTYGSGDVEGQLVYADVSLVGANLTNFKMGLVDSVNFQGYSSAAYDGILGLAWPDLNSNQNTGSIVPLMYTAGQFPLNLFAIYLSADGSSGELSLGEIDSSRYQGNLTYLPVVLQEWWTVNFNGLSVDGTTVPGTTDPYQLVIIDSGTSLNIGPNEQIINMMSAIQSSSGVQVMYDQNSGLYAVACSDVDQLPDLTFALSGSDNQQYLYTMPGESYVIASLSNDQNICPLAFQGSSSGPSSQVGWILGDPFMRTFYSVFDYANSRIGLAPAYPSAGSVIPGDKGAVAGTNVMMLTMVVMAIASML